MKGRDILKDLTEGNVDASFNKVPKSSASGSVRALKSELDKLADDAAAAKEMKLSIAKGGHVVELSTDLVDGASIEDRIPESLDQKFQDLKNSISASEQQVPILVRPHPSSPDRYEVAYGHRRLRATKELGVKVKAIIREMNDREMILAQGQENGSRKDLSFIERALYASKLSDAGYDRELICSALSVDKPETSRLLKVANSVAEEIILAIGPAQKIGRPRWSELSTSLGKLNGLDEVLPVIQSKEFREIEDTNDRFEYLYKRINQSPRKSTQTKKVKKNRLKGSGNENYGWSQITSKGVNIQLENKTLANYILDHLPSLIKEYENLQSGKKQ